MAMASILAGLKPVIRELAAGETLFASGDATRGFFLVRRGQIRLARFSASGCETLLFVAGPGERFAEASLFVETYHCDARAVAESSVACFPKSAALALLEGDATARLELTADLARQVMELRSALTLRDVRSARERVLGYLVARTGVDGRTITIGGPLKDIAAMIGLAPEVCFGVQVCAPFDKLGGRISYGVSSCAPKAEAAAAASSELEPWIVPFDSRRWIEKV